MEAQFSKHPQLCQEKKNHNVTFKMKHLRKVYGYFNKTMADLSIFY